MKACFRALPLAVALAAATGMGGCSDDDRDGAAGSLAPGAAGDPSAPVTLGSVADASAGSPNVPVNPLCGQPGDCGAGYRPGDPLACLDFDAGALLEAGSARSDGSQDSADGAVDGGGYDAGGLSDAATGGADGDAGAQSVEAGADSSVPDAASASGVDGGTAEAGGADGGDAGEPPDASATDGDGVGASDGDAGRTLAADAAPALRVSGYTCRVYHEPSSEEPRGRCEPAGFVQEEGACSSSAECAAGLACATTENGPRCLQLCCDPDADSCAEGRYCTERQRVESGRPLDFELPVCVTTDPCDLGAPVCGEGDAGGSEAGVCTCGPGLSCVLVRERVTSCVEAGLGIAGDPCPCAHGYHCSPVKQTCQQVCRLDSEPSTCHSGLCQVSAGFPEGYGLCIGG